MTVSSFSSSTSSLNSQAVAGRAGRHNGNGGPLDAAAKALGLSKDDLIKQLKSGQSLDDVATAQGVSHTDLAAAIKAGMPADLAASSKADDMVESIISRKGLPEALQGPRPGPPPAAGATSSSTGGASTNASGVLGSSLTDAQKSTLNALSSLLGTDPDNLLDSLKSGSSTLSDLISAKGVDQSSLASILQDGLLFDATV